MPDEPLPALSVQLRVRGRRCVVVGAGPVGARRAAALADAGAEVLVVAPDVCPAAEQLVVQGRVELRRRALLDQDLTAAFVVVTATGVHEVDDHAAALATASGALVNRADDGELGELVFPAVVRRGPVQVAVSSGGVAPGLSRELARRLADALDTATGLDGQELAVLVQVVEQLRAELRDEEGVTPGSLDWREVLDGSILDLIHQGRRAEAKERLLACLSSS